MVFTRPIGWKEPKEMSQAEITAEHERRMREDEDYKRRMDKYMQRRETGEVLAPKIRHMYSLYGCEDELPENLVEIIDAARELAIRSTIEDRVIGRIATRCVDADGNPESHPEDNYYLLRDRTGQYFHCENHYGFAPKTEEEAAEFVDETEMVFRDYLITPVAMLMLAFGSPGEMSLGEVVKAAGATVLLTGAAPILYATDALTPKSKKVQEAMDGAHRYENNEGKRHFEGIKAEFQDVFDQYRE